MPDGFEHASEGPNVHFVLAKSGRILVIVENLEARQPLEPHVEPRKMSSFVPVKAQESGQSSGTLPSLSLEAWLLS